jgi:hypothetical protein
METEVTEPPLIEVTVNDQNAVVIEPCKVDPVRLAKAMSVVQFLTKAHYLIMLPTAQRLVTEYEALE